ncbi:MAG: hypothetical protein PUD59_05300, partial [bacterium]|nr:hypothetical protein [bacterium]
MNEKKREENAKKDPIVGDYFDELNGRVDASDYYTQVYGQGAESNDEEIDYDKAKHKSNKKTAKKIVAL